MSSRRNKRGNKQLKKIMDVTDNQETDILVKEIHNAHDGISVKILRLSYNFIIYLFNIGYKTLKFILKISGIYLLWICLHYVASHLYITFCVPSTIFGFIMSPFMTATPHCLGLRWIVYNAANMINNMWLVLGSWICSTILIINHNKTHDAATS